MNLTQARQILGVDEKSSHEEIKKAYKKLAVKYHPDKNPGDNSAAKKFSDIQHAQDALLNPQKTNNSFYREKHKPYDPFMVGDDLRCNVSITLEECARGCTKKIKINKPVMCKTCKGNGLKEKVERSICSTCHGVGYVSINFGGMHIRNSCPSCRGIGSHIKPENRCSSCSGRRVVKENAEVEIEIPSGAFSGMIFKADGHGGEGIAGGPSGSLFIKIEVCNHEYFELIEDTLDLRLNYNISYRQHFYGDKIEIRTIYGDKILVEIPPKHNVINPIIKVGYGLPSIRRSGPDIKKGDLKIYLNIQPPESLEKEEEIMNLLNYKVSNKVDKY